MGAGVSNKVYGVFNFGLLATGPIEFATNDHALASPEIIAKITDLENHAAKAGLSLSEPALRFASQHPNCASVLFGPAKESTLL
jgi:aryl-alcohol dehydrogenase-like predicted oxidoreductase